MKWSTILPLIGGMAVGAEQALGSPPVHIVDFDGFGAWSSHYREYRPDSEYICYPVADKKGRKQAIKALSTVDLIVAVPPCAGLSNATPSDYLKKHRDDICSWMLHSLSLAMSSGCEIFIGENAPGLFTPRGQFMVENILQCVKPFGYNLSLLYIDTNNCGLPQKRQRAFFIVTKKPLSVNLHIEHKKCPKLIDFLNKVKHVKDIDKKLVSTHSLKDDTLFKWCCEFYGGKKQFRKKINEYGGNKCTPLRLIEIENKFPEALKFAKKLKDEGVVSRLKRYMDKMSIGLGYRDNSVLMLNETMSPTLVHNNLVHSIHPTKDRHLTTRECMSLMGLPNDFYFSETVNHNTAIRHLTQNVSVPTAKSIIDGVVRSYKDKDREDGDKVLYYDVIKQSKRYVEI